MQMELYSSVDRFWFLKTYLFLNQDVELLNGLKLIDEYVSQTFQNSKSIAVC